MISAECLFTVILVLVLLSAKAPGSDGFGESCPEDAIVDLTEETPDWSGFVNASGDIFPPESMWLENGTRFGCPCDVKRCVPLCCPLGYAASAGGCVSDQSNLGDLQFEASSKRSYVFISNPCNTTSPDSILRTSHYNVFDDGSIEVAESPWSIDLGSYCLFRDLNSTEYLAVTCVDTQLQGNGIWLLICTSVAVFFALVTYIVYSVVPELMNLQGWIIRSYLASYICLMILLTTVQILVLLKPSIDLHLYRAIVFGLYYFGSASILWLNVMSFDIWKKFRVMRTSYDVNLKNRQRSTFIRYSIYAWGTSTGLLVYLAWSTYLPDLLPESSNVSIAVYSVYVLILAGFACNTFFYTMTALRIKKCRMETEDLFDGTNKHYQENQQWFNLYLKLFVIMGCPIILWAVGIFWSNETFMEFVFLAEAVQGFFLFYTFVWKEDIRCSIQKQFAGILRRHGICLDRDSTPDAQDWRKSYLTRLHTNL